MEERCVFIYNIRKIICFQAENIPIIHMDETIFNMFISRREGSSKKEVVLFVYRKNGVGQKFRLY